MKPLRQGTSRDPSGESWVDWWIFPKLREDELTDVMEDNNIGRFHNGHGREFGLTPTITHVQDRLTVIEQIGGLDI